jgi:hypothetical protein
MIMRPTIRFAMLVASGAALFAMPAAAQPTQSTPSTNTTQSAKPANPPVPRFLQLNPSLNTKIPNTVHEGGHKYLGRDPDPVVRSQIMRDEMIHKGNN